MNWLNLTDRCVEALLLAQAEAKFLGDPHVGTEHLLIGLVVGGKTVGAQILAATGVDQAVIRGFLSGLRRAPGEPAPSRLRFTARAENTVVLAVEEARRSGAPMVTTDHLFIGLLHQPDCTAGQLLQGLGVDVGPFLEKLRAEASPRPMTAAGPVLVSGLSVLQVLDSLQDGLENFLARLIDRLLKAQWDVRWPRLDREEEVLPGDPDLYPVKNLVDMILSRGISAQAEQILMEPHESNLTIRYVFHGGGSEQVEAPKVFKDILPFNVMRLACLNPMEKGRELHGEMVFAHRGRDHRMEVHSEPIHKGVKLCIQVLNRAA